MCLTKQAMVAAVLGLSFCACGPTVSGQREAVLKRAKFDLECERVDVSELGDRTFGATGCGRRATYITEGSCGNPMQGGGQCTAIMNSDSENVKSSDDERE